MEGLFDMFMRSAKFITFSVFCLLVITAVPSLASFAENGEYQGSYIRRPTLVVSDMERSLLFYRDILGFQLGSLTQDPEDSYVFEAFNIPSGTKVIHATLNSDLERRTLSLLEVKTSMRESDGDAIRRTGILINTNGRFDEIRKQLEDAAYHTLSSHSLGETGIEMGVIDPDGYLIVLYEFPSS